MAAKPPPGSQADSAVPILRVMRLQSPELYQPYAGSLESRCILGTAMCLPDSLGVVYVGETFTAYLGALNVSNELPVRRLTVSALLQTPSQRYRIPSTMDAGNAAGGVDVPPNGGINAIVSHALEEAGSHILRVEVGYVAQDGGVKTFRKFYRFQVSHPLTIRELTVRSDEETCIVSISVEYTASSATTGLVICTSEFVPAEGLSVEKLAIPSKKTEGGKNVSALDLLDRCERLEAGNSFRYLFKVKASSKNASLRGIAAGDELGKAMFTWSKTMGERGRIASSPIRCPEANPNLKSLDATKASKGEDSNFVVHGSGLSVDVASAAAKRAANAVPNTQALDFLLPVTVEPINPPSAMALATPSEVQFLVVNHASHPMTLQLQFRLDQMTGLAICGQSFKSLGELAPHGGCTIVSLRLMAISAGLLRVQGCSVVDLVAGRKIPQPPLFDVFVDHPKQ